MIPGGTERRTADMMRADLLAAKRKWIDEANDEAERRRLSTWLLVASVVTMGLVLILFLLARNL